MPIPKPKRNEKKLDFLNRCMADSVMTDDYRIPAQRYAVCNLSFEQTRKDQKANSVKSKVLKIGFDYDGVVSTDKGKKLLTEKLNEGSDIWIISGTAPSTTKFNMADKLGVKESHVIFIAPLDKWKYLKENNFDYFYDNNPNQVDRINQNTDTKAILFKD